jgi:hypothetical protein
VSASLGYPLRLPQFAALPAAADYAGRMLQTSAGVFWSNGDAWTGPFGEGTAPPSGGPAIAGLRVGGSGKGQSTSSVAAAAGYATLAGSANFALVVWNPNGTPVISDNNSNIYVQVGTKISLLGFPGFVSLYAALDIAGGSNTIVTSTIPGAVAQTILAWEWRGALDLAAIELLGSGTDTSAPFSVTAASSTQAYESIFAAVAMVGTGVTVPSETTGMASVIEENASSFWQACVFAKTVDSIGAYTPSFNITNCTDVGMFVVGVKGNPSAVRLGSFSFEGQEDNNGVTPAQPPAVNTSASNSTFLAWIAGLTTNDIVPTDNFGNAYSTNLGADVYLGYSGLFNIHGYATQDGVGGSAHTVQFAKATPARESSAFFCEVKNAPDILDFAINYPTANPNTSAIVTTNGPAVLVAVWGGDAPGLVHVATPDGGYKVIQAYGTLPPQSAVQFFAAYLEVYEAGDYSVTWTSSPNQGAICYLVACGQAGTASPALTLDDVLDSSTRLAMLPAERTKLGVLPTWMQRILLADQALTNDTSNQSWFLTAGGLPLLANSTYEFEGDFLSTNGATSHGLNMQFDAITGASIKWWFVGAKAAINNQATALRMGHSNTFNTNRNVTTASTVAGNVVYVKGVIVTGGTSGTFRPRVSQTAASGSFVVLAQTSMRVRRIGSNALVNSGEWV